MNIKTLLKTVQSRTQSYGIGTAAPFLRQFERCLGGMCPAKCFESVSESRWRRAVKAAQRQLVYHHPEMGAAGEFEKTASRAELPPHTIALFPAVVTTTRQDRDGDILETRGAELDPKAPLLYQHMPFANVGRLLRQIKRTSKELVAEFSLCGTPLGEDCAMLAEHGALRISHGFLAEEFEPLDEKEYEIPGFRVLRFKILEVSLVSIPSNPDAEITAFSRNKFKHPLTKAVAEFKFNSRPAVSAVEIDVETLSPRPTAARSVGDDAGCMPVERCRSTCACRKRSQSCILSSRAAEMFAKSPSTRCPAQHAVDHLHHAGEEASRGAAERKEGRIFSAFNLKKLRGAASNFRAIADDDEAHSDVAGLAGKGYAAVKSMFDSGGDSGGDYDEAGEFTGDDLDAYSATDQEGKAGRAVSRENAALICKAIRHARAISAHEAALQHHKALADRAASKLSAVLGQAENISQDDDDGGMGLHGGNPTNSEPVGKSASDACDALLRRAIVEHAQTGDMDSLKALAGSLIAAVKKTTDTISRIERQFQWELGDALIADAVKHI